MTDYYRRAVEAALSELRKPFVDLTPDEQEHVAERALGYLVEWDVFREDSAGSLRGGRLLLEANRA